MFFRYERGTAARVRMTWSKCKLSLLPHSTHLPWSRFHTASFTSVFGNDAPRALLSRRGTGGVVSMLVRFVMLVGGINLPPAALAYLWFLPVGGYTLMWAGLA
jgi:hypothetical protein